MPGLDAYTKLLLHMNGTDGSTVFTDESSSSHSVTANGSCEIDTAQSKFGGASGLFPGANADRLSIPDSSDWDFGSGDFTVDFPIKFNSFSGVQALISQWGGGGSNGSFYIVSHNANLRFFYSPDGGSEIAFPSTYDFVDTNWHHVAVVRDGTVIRFFVDGVAYGTGAIGGATIFNSSRVLNISTFQDGTGQPFDGWMDEVRISKGIARWTSAFTPPSQEYDSNTIISDTLNITDSIATANTLPKDDITLQISDSIITSSFNPSASFANKIISINPLIFVTGVLTPEIVKVDTTDPQNLTWEIQVITGITNAQDVTIDSSGSYVYVAGTSGLISKINISDLTDQTLLDLNDTDNIETIQSNINFGLIYAGTENTVGELYVIDNRDAFTLDSNFNALSEEVFPIEANFNIVDNFIINSNFNVLADTRFNINSDFKCLTKEIVPLNPISPVDDIIPINLEDFQVFLNSVELENTDLILNSISIVHSVSEESRASFQLSRKHDQLDTTLEGVSSQITNQNVVEIKIKGNTEFLGKVSELDCRYDNDREYIIVNALADEKENKFNTVKVSLPGINTRLSIYDVLIQNPVIFNPYIDSTNEDSPKKFKGIRVDLGLEIKQSLSKWTIFDSSGSIAEKIKEGTFNPLQNWTYFWSPTVRKLGTVGLGETVAIHFFYIGTSLAPVSEDLWDLTRARHWRQRIRDDIETELGVYEVGEAPFKEISVRNGLLLPKPRLVDETDGLYSVTDAGYNFIDYATTIADLEYENLKNISGEILPDTSCSFNLTTDSYLYYNISLLTRMNVDNTSQSNIYNNLNGFPVSVKSITITSSDRKVSIQADNIKSTKELEVINAQFPDEDDEEYNTEEKRIRIATKTDMRTRLKVE